MWETVIQLFHGGLWIMLGRRCVFTCPLPFKGEKVQNRKIWLLPVFFYQKNKLTEKPLQFPFHMYCIRQHNLHIGNTNLFFLIFFKVTKHGLGWYLWIIIIQTQFLYVFATFFSQQKLKKDWEHWQHIVMVHQVRKIINSFIMYTIISVRKNDYVLNIVTF